MISEHDIEDWDLGSREAYQVWSEDYEPESDFDTTQAWRAAIIWVRGQGML